MREPPVRNIPLVRRLACGSVWSGYTEGQKYPWLRGWLAERSAREEQRRRNQFSPHLLLVYQLGASSRPNWMARESDMVRPSANAA